MNWKPGDVAELCGIEGPDRVHNGMEVTLVARAPAYVAPGAWWIVDAAFWPMDVFGVAYVAERCLRRRPNPPNWNALATPLEWEEV